MAASNITIVTTVGMSFQVAQRMLFEVTKMFFVWQHIITNKKYNRFNKDQS
jgi:hypothetical protein